MRKFSALLLWFAPAAFAATLSVDIDRNGFTGPIQLAVAPRVDGKAPVWSETKTLPTGASSSRFELPAGLYVVMVSGPEPLQRLSAKANVGSDGAALHLVIPRSKTELRTTLGGEPLPHAKILFTHRQLRWDMSVETGDDGCFTGELWEPEVYTAAMRRDALSAPYPVDVWLAAKAVTIDVPDRHVTGRVVAGGKPLGGAIVQLRSENSESTLNLRASTAPDGRFEFFGVREGELMLTARAPSYLDSDPVLLEQHGPSARQVVEIELQRGESRPVRVVDARGAAIANASLIVSCDGHVKSMAATNAEGKADVALRGDGARCALFVVPKEGSLAIQPVRGSGPLLIRVPEGTSSLRLTLKSQAGEVFSAMSLLMRIDGAVVPPAVSRLLSSRGYSLMTNDDGSMLLQHIPPGTYEFWPYRTASEGQLLYETAAEFDAPISVKVLTGPNDATVKFAAR